MGRKRDGEPSTSGKPRRDGIADILRTGQFPGVVVKGTRKGEHGNPMFKKEHLAPNYRKGMTAAQSEKLDKKIVAEKREKARRVKRDRGLSRKGDDHMELSGSIPYSLMQAERNRTGDHDIWKHDGENLRKKHGLDF